MGMRPSPYNAVRYFCWGEEFARGDRSMPTNPMGYDEVRLNLPGMSEYEPDLEALIEFNPPDPARSTTIIPLLGRVKGGHHSRQHLLTSVNTTDSGIHVNQWVQRVLTVHRSQLNPEGNQSTTSEMNDLFLEVLSNIYEAQPDMFAPDIKNTADLGDKYNVFRSFRRGSEPRAVAKKVSEADRYIVHRWKRKENAGANRVNRPIDQHYVDVQLVTDSFLRYTKAM